MQTCLMSSEKEICPKTASRAAHTVGQTILSRSRFALGCKEFFEFIQPNIPTQFRRRRLDKCEHRLGPVVRHVSSAGAENVTPTRAQPKGHFVRIENWHIVGVRDDGNGKFRLLGSSILLARYTLGKNHVLLRLVDAEPKQLLLDSADAVPRTAFNNIAKRTKIDTHTHTKT